MKVKNDGLKVLHLLMIWLTSYSFIIYLYGFTHGYKMLFEIGLDVFLLTLFCLLVLIIFDLAFFAQGIMNRLYLRYVLYRDTLSNKKPLFWLKYEKFGNSVEFLRVIELDLVEFPENCVTPIMKTDFLINRIKEKLGSKEEVEKWLLFFEMKNTGLTIQKIIITGLFSYGFFSFFVKAIPLSYHFLINNPNIPYGFHFIYFILFIVISIEIFWAVYTVISFENRLSSAIKPVLKKILETQMLENKNVI